MKNNYELSLFILAGIISLSLLISCSFTLDNLDDYKEVKCETDGICRRIYDKESESFILEEVSYKRLRDCRCLEINEGQYVCNCDRFKK